MFQTNLVNYSSIVLVFLHFKDKYGNQQKNKQTKHKKQTNKQTKQNNKHNYYKQAFTHISSGASHTVLSQFIDFFEKFVFY